MTWYLAACTSRWIVSNGRAWSRPGSGSRRPSAEEEPRRISESPHKGYAKRGMRDLCRLLLDEVPAVCLFVRPENTPAIRVYEGIGMQRHGSYRSLIF